jgi:uncharacterized cupin superfamily protein
MVTPGPKPAGAAGDATHPGIFRIPLDTPLTERAVYPPGIAVGSFDGAYTIATMYKSGVFAGNKVAFWGSEAGALKAGNYPPDEFVYVLEGDLVTVDADGTRHEFHPGDALVIPKGLGGNLGHEDPFQEDHRQLLTPQRRSKEALPNPFADSSATGKRSSPQASCLRDAWR